MSTHGERDGLLRVVLVVVAVLVLLPAVLMALAMPTMGMMGWSGPWTGGFVPVWIAGMGIAWLAILVGIAYLLYRAVAGGQSSSGRSDAALEELRLAYARGDLSDEEFEERRERLTRDE